jgi:predicted O-linked N-acetylglucosamine transferase (SPINDLY family)
MSLEDNLSIQNAMQSALEHHRAGRLSEAERIYERILTTKPDYAEAWSNRGVALQELKRYDEALASYEKALSIKPDFAEALSNRGIALQELKRYDEALASYDKALAIKPDYDVALSNRGNTLHSVGRYDEALVSCDKALTIKPNFAEAWSNRGNTLRALGRYIESLVSCQKALSIKPHHAMAHNNFANTLDDLGRLREAEQAYRRALSFDPGMAMAHSNLGALLLRLGQPREAERSCRRALKLKPDYADAHNNLGNALKPLGRLEEAEQCYRRALELRPDLDTVHSNLIFTLDLQERTDAEMQQAERRRWYAMHGASLAGSVRPYENSPVPERRLRIGYVSADFCRRSPYYAFGPVIDLHDRSAFEVVCYSGVRNEDDATARLRRAAHLWRTTLGVSDEAIAEQIRRDRIDILVDLSGHMDGNRLRVFARKPAPVQVTAWGYANGTGLKTIDYLFTDPVTFPAQDRKYLAEQVVDLPCAICYEAPEYMPAVSTLPALGDKPFTFGCINRIEKISDSTLQLWGRIMSAAPEARLLIKDGQLGDAGAREGLLGRLGQIGVGAGRVLLLGGSPHPEHLKIYHQVDVVVDPFPHGGGISTGEALWIGVPVVALIGRTAVSRVSASILTAAGMSDWIATSGEDYVDIAVKKAGNPIELARLRNELRPRMAQSPIGDVQSYTRTVESAYRSIWRHWCSRSRLGA